MSIQLGDMYSYEGRYYRSVALHCGAGSARGQDYVEYVPLYPCERSSFVRPVAEFLSKFKYEG